MLRRLRVNCLPKNTWNSGELSLPLKVTLLPPSITSLPLTCLRLVNVIVPLHVNVIVPPPLPSTALKAVMNPASVHVETTAFVACPAPLQASSPKPHTHLRNNRLISLSPSFMHRYGKAGIILALRDTRRLGVKAMF